MAHMHNYFTEGRKAWLEKGRLAENPYIPGTPAYESWDAGVMHEWYNEKFGTKEDK